MKDNKEGYGLGFTPTMAERKKLMEDRREKRIVRLEGREPSGGVMVILHIKITFPCPTEIMQPEPVKKELDDELEYLSELFARELSVCILVTKEDPVTPVLPHQSTKALRN